ncbi:hypothetical protein B0T26DRAFT_245907 [Lasiosphaeria miniovina]|uniref:Uncharacterized protein n=1 Tax=Lasiosphaeria miniovina TaxID=1954250 RepID=A0AA40AVY3_9PEZI|nr:uncharacterized protein B0T26DRAFT_245907 [Lasiosphaeria miniovina]KAK0723032.1 hypothetical protein B0T26DRAFT_245907 [Lasiosphaeria miniovina]
MAINQTQAAKDSLQEEQHLEDALEHLKELHLQLAFQLRRLRSVLPRMLEPLASKQPSPQASYDAFLESVDATDKEIASFKTAISSDETKKLIQKANKSRQANPKGLKPWRPRDDPQWTTTKRQKTKDA